MAGCKFSAKFWGDQKNGSGGFCFKGSLTDPKTFEITQRKDDELSDSDDQWEIFFEEDWDSQSDGDY